MNLYAFAKIVVPPVGRLLFRMKEEGTENLPESGPVIVCSNHRSNYDPVLLGIALKRPLFFMAKDDLFKIPLFSSLIRKLGAFPVHRGKGDSSAIQRGIDILKEGCVLAMFPEGHRLKTGRDPQRFQSGAVRIAIQTHATIVPVAIVTKGKVGMFRRTVVKTGKPVPFEELGIRENSLESIRSASALIRSRVIELLESARVEHNL